MKSTVFLFGEAEKGEFGIPLSCNSLSELLNSLGNPPTESQGMHFAIQTLLYKKELIFCRVKEEGFSKKDYMSGITQIRKRRLESSLQAIFIPGVGDQKIIEATMDICSLSQSLLVLTEKDLYDYLTSSL
jgi:hypothetical protein